MERKRRAGAGAGAGSWDPNFCRSDLDWIGLDWMAARLCILHTLNICCLLSRATFVCLLIFETLSFFCMEWVRDVLHYITVLLIMDWIDIAKPWHVALDARGLAGGRGSSSREVGSEG